MRKRISIKKLVLLMGLLPILCLNIAMGVFFIHSQIETLREQMYEQARTSSQQLSL
ncbi:MAG: hypothetical protein ACSHWQ_06820 [Spongiibacteraceae bacterium]